MYKLIKLVPYLSWDVWPKVKPSAPIVWTRRCKNRIRPKWEENMVFKSWQWYYIVSVYN